MMKRKTLGGQGKKRLLLSGDHLTILGFLLLVLILSLRKLRGFSIYGFPKEKHCVHCLLCLIAILVVLSVKAPNIMLA